MLSLYTHVSQMLLDLLGMLMLNIQWLYCNCVVSQGHMHEYGEYKLSRHLNKIFGKILQD